MERRITAPRNNYLSTLPLDHVPDRIGAITQRPRRRSSKGLFHWLPSAPLMWPWGHLAVSYLAYSLGMRFLGRKPSSSAVVSLVVGTLIPDVIDKPLAWGLGLFESGRALAHSPIVAATLIVPVLVVFHLHRGPNLGVPFAIGYLLHLPLDAPSRHDIQAIEIALVPFWPWSRPESTYASRSVPEHIAAYFSGPFEVFQIILFVAALLVWQADGAPGWSYSEAVFPCRRKGKSGE